MRRLGLVVRLSTVFISMTLITGYVAWQAGALQQGATASGDTSGATRPTSYISSTKRAVIVTPDNYSAAPVAANNVPAPPPPVAGAGDFHAYSSKSGVPLVDVPSAGHSAEQSNAGPRSPDAESGNPHTRSIVLPSTKLIAPLIQFPKPYTETHKDWAGNPVPGSTPIDLPDTLSGSKSFVPLIEVPNSKAVEKQAPKTHRGKGG